MPDRKIPRIVIIDDHIVNVKLLCHILSKDKVSEPIGFTDPYEGLRYCLDHIPCLVIVDYSMPAMDGISLTERLRVNEATREIPVLMVTANHERELRHRALDAGATDFLTKPIDNRELLARARNMLKLRLAARRDQDLAGEMAEAVRKATSGILLRERELVYRISRAAEFRDPETGAHIQRIAHFSRLIAKSLGLSAEEQEMIFEAAPMHDVGKIAIPDAILLKPGKLTEAEFEVMKRHTQMGYDLLRDSNAPTLQTGALIAYTHHEKFDGSGYPRRLSGSDIPLVGRIVAVADVFDALTTARPYKAPWTPEAARRYLISGRGNHFDPRCVDALKASWGDALRIMREFHDPEPSVLEVA